MKKLLSMFLTMCMVLTLLPISALAEDSSTTVSIGDIQITEANATTIQGQFDAIGSNIATVTSSNGKITIKLLQNLTGRIEIHASGHYIIDANGHTLSGGSQNEAIGMGWNKNVTLELVGNGTYHTGVHNTLVVNNNTLIIKSATIHGKLNNSGTLTFNLEDGYSYFTVKNNSMNLFDEKNVISKTHTSGITGTGTGLVVAQYTAAPTITSEPSASTIAAGANTTFSVTASDATGYQWQVDTGSGFTDIANGAPYSGATTATLTITGATAGLNGNVYRVIASGLALPDATSNSAILTVNTIPGAPIITSIAAGDTKVSLAWNPLPDTTGYKIYRSETTGSYGVESATVTGSVYSYDVTGLINGTTYYFVVKAVNPGGESSASNEVSAIPMTVPAAPTNVSAVAGDGKATITFTAPIDNGGSAITGYEVTASPGGVVVTGTASSITFTGLSNGTSYTFTVKAINGVGPGTSSTASNAVIPIGSSSTSNGGSPTPVPSEAVDLDVKILVNSKGENAETATTTKVNDRTVTTVTIDQKKIEAQLAAEGSSTRVTIRVNSKPDVVIVELNGQMVKDIESKQGIIEIQTNHATYALSAEQINMDSISEKFGKQVALQDIKIRIEIATLTADSMGVAENAAAKGTFDYIAPPLSFTVKAEHVGSIVEVSKFNSYVERSIALPDGIDRNKVTTGVIIEVDSSVRHVPTKVIVKEGKPYAVINSLANSTYAVVWHPLEFQDVANHWAKEAVNNMGSRMVIDGEGGLKFNPDRDITRAEFVAIIVRGLGLKPDNGTSISTDVKADWYSSAINTAYAYHLIGGLKDETFRPKDKISREQAMVIIAKAMEITGLKQSLATKSTEDRLRPFTDAADASEWAKSSIAVSVQAGIISGRSNTVLAPKALLTRAEVAVIIERLLQKSDLI